MIDPPFGWCLDGNHPKCRTSFWDGYKGVTRHCGCKCHDESGPQ